MQNNSPPHTFITLICEVKLNPTEDKDVLGSLLQKFLPGEIQVDDRSDGTYLFIKTDGSANLTLLFEWVGLMKIIDSVRSRLLRSIQGNVTAIYFNRNAALMDYLALVDVNDSIPLGPIAFQIVSDNLEEIINIVTPETFDGKIISEDEKQKILAKRERKRLQRDKAQKRADERDRKFLEEIN